MNFCLNPSIAQEFKSRLDDGSLDVNKLSQMTSEERRSALEEVVGKENAQEVNSSFEGKLLLKDSQAGLERWVKNLTDVSPKVKSNLFDKIAKMDKVLDTANSEGFLKDLASTKLGVDVTDEEARTISDLSKQVSDSKEEVKTAVDEKGYGKETENERLKLGASKVALQNYVGDLKSEANTLTVADRLKLKNAGRNVNDILSSTKGMVASLSSHAPLRHGFMALFEDPKDWAKNYVTQASDAFNSIKGKDVLSDVKTEGYSRENSINGIYDKWIPGELTKTNEEYSTDIPSKIPIAGKLFKASKDVFNGFNLKMRMDLTDHYVNVVEKMGLDPHNPEVAQSWGKLVLDQTGGKSQPGIASKFLFSERLIRSQANNLTAHLFDKTTDTATKVQSAKTLAKMVIGVGAVMATANAISPGSVETDPRSSDFGTIRINNTRYDISGGMKGLITLAARLASFSTKSSTTGKITSLGSGTFATSTATLIGNFLEGRSSPLAQAFFNLADQQTFNGGKPTVTSELQTLFEPIPLQDYQNLSNDKSANTIGTMIAQQLGVMSSTYGSPGPQYSATVDTELNRLSKKGYSVSISDPTGLKLFKDIQSQKGDSAYNNAVDEYNNKVATDMNNVVNSSEYKTAPIGATDPSRTSPSGTKAAMLKQVQSDAQKFIKSEYNVNTTTTPVTSSSDL